MTKLVDSLVKSSKELKPITLDLRNNFNPMISESRILSLGNTRIFSLMEEYMEEYRIGEVRDGDILVYEDSLFLIYRSVLFFEYSSGVRYAQITSSYLNKAGSITKEVVERINEANYGVYTELIKDFVVMDLKKKPPHYLIKESGNKVRKFQINRLFTPNVVIGPVKYGEYILDDAVEGVISKIVEVEGSIVRIETLFNDGFGIKTLHRVVGSGVVTLYTERNLII
ncbi:hypothetical protein BEWA_045900 [Theileria equi strain WA]|uniref:Uncharacterized protein n=1 Tax=Theileria equi strain WA TaxID=1537102 RepID=L1L9F5_THEEQ|nr:hypothetical protein BEWA_045900 [Theileria equi strain WA]EKX72126.1 hypothetical protein BEWA_045900 [Theileria equi strain WA]|eukprot:XP_004831578.1 hypothetical protein BEWA_045900 [Theileria equi strain WA]